ncbi:MAG TPA: hypothetical protein V6D22_11355 [Candidatus Obscuribacterales bacterium]
MINKEKLLLLATIYMLVPGAMPDAMADNVEAQKHKSKKSQTVQKVHQQAAASKLNEQR